MRPARVERASATSCPAWVIRGTNQMESATKPANQMPSGISSRKSASPSTAAEPMVKMSANQIASVTWNTLSLIAGASWICLLAMRPAKSSEKNESDWRSILRCVRQRIRAPIAG